VIIVSNDGDFDDNVVKARWLHARQSGHLGAAFDLKDAYGVRVLHHLERFGIVWREICEIDRMAASAS